MEPIKALVLQSGGIDSTTCLAIAVQEYGAENVHSIGINYGQRHIKEMEYAEASCAFFGVSREILELNPIENNMLTDETRDIPDISYDEITGVSPTYVPFRNGLMLANMASIAQARGFGRIYYGAHAEDALNWAYPDCTPEFNGSMANAIYIGTYHAVQLITPLQWMGKKEILWKGAELGVPWEKTWSCYKGEDKHCGVCPTCRARKQGFIDAQITDPTEYAA